MYACCIVIATVLNWQHDFSPFFKHKMFNDKRETNSYPSNPPGSSQDIWAGKKINNPNPRKLKWISDIFYKVGQKTIVK